MGIRKFIKHKAVWATGSILCFLAFLSFIFWIIEQVSSGKGADIYQNHWGLNLTPIGVLIFFFFAIIAAIIGVILVAKERRLKEDFLKKYGKKRQK